MFCCLHFLMLSTAQHLLHLTAGEFRLNNNIANNIEQCGSKTLFNVVFINPEQVVHFFAA